MKISRIALLATLIASTGISAAYANETAHRYEGRHPARMHMMGFGGEPPLARLAQKLDLTQEQQQSLRSLLESTKAARKNLHEEQRANFEASLTVLPDDPSYPAMIEKRKQLAAESIQQRSDLNVQIYGLLTPEQKAKVPALIDEAKSKMQERRATHQRRGGDPR